MSEIPAFPVVGQGIDEPWRGMSLRDYFAAAALQGLLVALPYTKGDDGEPIKNVIGVAGLAYKQADAMLKTRLINPTDNLS